ncbi:hypothetical protein ACF0H5_001339 [Mactra antiquata]
MQIKMRSIHQLLCVFVALSIFVSEGDGYKMAAPKTLKVDCKSLGDNEKFIHRVKYRANAEDNITIWLFQDEELSIHFHLPEASLLEVLDVRYSNDGGMDLVEVNLDDKMLGQFRTPIDYLWGIRWNKFRSSGPLGGQFVVERGNHKLTLAILVSDKYGIEIDYIRFNVHGSKIDNLENELECIHNPSHRKED